jgi:hypothetical protein
LLILLFDSDFAASTIGKRNAKAEVATLALRKMFNIALPGPNALVGYKRSADLDFDIHMTGDNAAAPTAVKQLR